MNRNEMTRRIIVPAAVFSLLLLSACAGSPDMDFLGPRYDPVTADIARAAAPAPVRKTRPLYCAVANGTAHIGKAWLGFARADFTLSRDLPVNVTLYPRKAGGEGLTFQGIFEPEGQKMVFCPVVHAAPGTRISCFSLYALDEDLQAGIKRTFDIPNAVQGAFVTCAYNKSALKKL
jgi:hypothetical protein